MSSVSKANDLKQNQAEIIKRAVGLLSQQIWCWGQDIKRPEGNWLLEIGFKRTKPPSDRSDCASNYCLELPRERCVVLRGFGTFYGDRQYGGIFLPRFEFLPKYTTEARLECPAWSTEDLPNLTTPSESERSDCLSLTLDLLDWIRNYELTIIEQLGTEYRQMTLEPWDGGKRPTVPAEKIASAWEELSLQVAANFDLLS